MASIQDQDAFCEELTHFLNEKAGIVVKWSLQMEAVDDQGEQALHTVAGAGQAAWDTLGMIEFHSRYLASRMRSS